MTADEARQVIADARTSIAVERSHSDPAPLPGTGKSVTVAELFRAARVLGVTASEALGVTR
ncbi:hypothetical protein ABLE94_02660 [Gordonia sp. VNK1]|uniref:hypothetical protein n=1 Tax=Gordonia oleivorans TaxID=3156618 RepID=UPI0032B5B117